MSFFCSAFIMFLYVSFSLGAETCKPLQYLEFGLAGLIECSFYEDYHGVVWYNSENFVHEESIVRYFGVKKEGYGYVSGQFDICLNGSLIIKNVSWTHDHTFAVMRFDSQDDNPVPILVKVVVTVRPSTPFPHVDKCGSAKNCFVSLDQMTETTCLVQHAKPAIGLSWVTRTAVGDKNVTFESTLTEHDKVFTSRAIMLYPIHHSSLLNLLVCQADDSAGTLAEDETLIMIERNDDLFSSATAIKVFIERGSKLELTCLNTNTSLIAWRISHDFGETYELLSYAALFDDNFSEIFSEEYHLKKNGILVLPTTEVKHEGYYGCISDDMVTSNVRLYHVLVYVIARPLIDGCRLQHQHCVLKKNKEDSITCSAIGVRPVVTLEFNALSQEESTVISFHDRQVNTIKTGQTYTIRMTSYYRIKSDVTTPFTIECRMSGTNIKSLNINAVVILSIEREQTTDAPNTPNGSTSLLWVVVAVILTVMTGLCVALLLYRRVRKRSKFKTKKTTDSNQEQVISLLEKPIGDLSEKLSTFTKELKQKYENLCNEVRPVPFLKSNKCCVNSVIVQGGFKYCTAKGLLGACVRWETLSSYSSIFKEPHLTSKRRIVEGEAGYGKSIFALQMAHDWYSDIFPLNKMKILILLRLRQMRGVISFYNAIKQFLLPSDSKLTAKDVENLIATYAESTVIILDGYDEIPEIQSGIITDIVHIMAQDMLSQCEVIVTSRSSCLPENIAASAKRFKLTGFDAASRDEYLQKVIFKNDNDSIQTTELVKTNLQEDPVLHDVCQVPLFFVMYVHMSHAPHKPEKFYCVTRFFRNVIWCFHSHMKNKQEDENVQKRDSYESDHKKLNKVAFEGLTSQNGKLTWQKETLCRELGEEFYEQYVRIGILVEDDSEILNDNPGEHACDTIHRRTEVRFFHKLFCEWYAAHYLSEYALKNDLIVTNTSPLHHPNERASKKPTTNVLETLNDSSNDVSEHFLERLPPGANEYVYRFACELNRTAGEKIIKYLESIEDGEKFAILCILEQHGDVQNVLETIRKLCLRDVYIDMSDKLLLQRSVINLLTIASQHQILITRVRLIDCFSSISLPSRELHLSSGLCMPVINTLQQLVIRGRTIRKLIQDDTIQDILQYSSMCEKLEYVRFKGCMLPQCIENEGLLTILKTKNIAVIWKPLDIQHESNLHLNLDSGLWEREGTGDVMTEEMYNKELKEFQNISQLYDEYK